MKCIDKNKSDIFNDNNKQKTLPIIPIVLGGDDITFVCNSIYGIKFSEIFIKNFEKTKFKDEKFTACAGISITKTTYPFYQSYKIAEELCKNAKHQRETDNEETSYFDFHIFYSGIVGSLSYIRNNFYTIFQTCFEYICNNRENRNLIC